MKKVMSFSKAINLAMEKEMDQDHRVFAFGVDVQDHKRTFGSGEGLSEKFGAMRFFGSPISEAGVTGVAVGAALCGLRPIHIHARADFTLLAMNQLVNMASIKSSLSNGKSKVPLVVRSIIGRSWGQGPQHSKTTQSVFAHFPGLKVVLPSDPQDGYSLLRSAIQDDDPVIFLEHRWLYDTVGEVDEDRVEHLGRAVKRRSGNDITIVATSWMVIEAMQAARILSNHGIQSDVIDLRTVSPLDLEGVIESVEKTGRVVIADADWTFCGLSSEISAQISEECFSSLRASPQRIGFAPVPCPTTRPLENLFYPSARDIVKRIEELLDIPPCDLSNEIFNEYENRFKGPF